jgi:hypothetical protein
MTNPEPHHRFSVERRPAISSETKKESTSMKYHQIPEYQH